MHTESSSTLFGGWPDPGTGHGHVRRANWNRWGYHQTYGLGFYEYFLLCEDLGAAPLPVVPVGVSCGYNQPYEAVPLDELQEWIDDALDLVEFANGPADSPWGKIRAQMGHPEPFGLEYLCLGNEEHDTPQVRERIPYFVQAIREAYPEIKLIGTSGLSQNVPLYPLMKELNLHSSDEHYYNVPEWYIENQNRFDGFERNGPKIFVGEYASQCNTMFNAVAEAAYLTGIERNADIVDMACYAPLFAHVNHTQWKRQNLIWFDARNVVKTPNYYVQQLFSRNKGDVYLKNNVVPAEDESLSDIGVSATLDKRAYEVILKLVNPRNKALDARINLDGVDHVKPEATRMLLAGDRNAQNTIANPDVVKPETEAIRVGKTFDSTLPPMSVQVIRISLGRSGN